MKDLFDGFGARFKELDPEVQKKAKELAKQLMEEEGYDKATAIKEAIKQAEQRFLDLEG